MSTTQELARLVRVDPREIWTSESSNFTPWLAEEGNLSLLSETLNIDLELEAQEKDVGPFRADILCRDTGTGDWVLIENQLERTDHGHLGQLLTYASGLQAVTIIWISKTFTEEHRSTLDWLNEITDDKFSFFGLEIEAWRVGNSPPAPKFNVVAKPNDWSRSVARSASDLRNNSVSPNKQLQRSYWTALAKFISESGSSLRPQKPAPQHWTVFGMGKTGFHLAATVNSKEQYVGVELYVDPNDNKSSFFALRDQRVQIEQEIGAAMDWQELPERRASRIILRLDGALFSEQNDWDRQHSWLKDNLEKLDKAFRTRLKSL